MNRDLLFLEMCGTMLKSDIMGRDVPLCVGTQKKGGTALPAAYRRCVQIGQNCNKFDGSASAHPPKPGEGERYLIVGEALTRTVPNGAIQVRALFAAARIQ